MPPSKEELVKFVPAKGFKESYRKLKKSNPEIKKSIKIFNEYKREKPPKALPNDMKDHALKGKSWAGYRECHLAPDILLIYTHEKDVVTLLKIYSHDEIMGKRGKRNIKTIRRMK
jgi:mRNA interferase YafQ